MSAGSAAVDQVVAETAAWVGEAVSLGDDASSLVNLASKLVGSYGRYFNGRNQGFNNTLASVYGPSTTVADLIAQGTASRAALAAAAQNEITIAGGLGLPGSLTADLASAAQATVAAVVANTADPADTLRLLTSLAAYSTGSEGAIAGAVGDLHRRAVVAALARATAVYQPASADDAANVRDQVGSAIDNETLIAGNQGEDATFAALRALRTAVISDMQARGAGLAPLTMIVTNDTQPALTLANRLYRDASRADQLVRFADPIHPLFMPTSFRALAA